MNQMRPEYEIQAGLRSFGHHPELSTKDTMVVYAMESYRTVEFGRTLYEIKPACGSQCRDHRKRTVSWTVARKFIRLTPANKTG